MKRCFPCRPFRLLLSLLLTLLLLSANRSNAADEYDLVVVGGTPGGIATAVTAARYGHSVALVEYHRHVGGMTASGLGKSDINTRSAVAGLFTEFTDRVHRDYIQRYGADSEEVKDCRQGYYYEPSVAERIFDEILTQERKLRLFKGHQLQEVIRSGRRLVGIRIKNRDNDHIIELRGRLFADATYEGDLAAFAGARSRLGRESRAEFGESHAGVIYMDHTLRTFLEGSTGEGDRRLPAYTFRLCLSSDPDNSVAIPKPPGYDRSRYLNYFDDLKLGRLDTALKAMTIAPIPNNKTDCNMKAWALGFPFSGENYAYPEADWPERERITEHLRNITLGLVYFLQNDPELSDQDRTAARRYGLAKDEFTDNDHFPWQLYVREARRVVGLYTITEHDLVLAPHSHRAPVKHDAIATAAFPIDSFPTRKREPGRDRSLEGYLFMMRNITRPYQIPYRAIVSADVEGLLVPVPLSATHIAFSAIRMEPTWMAIGQAAGTAAHLSLIQSKSLRDIQAEVLQRELLKHRQVISHFEDREECGEFGAAVQFCATKGFFDSYRAEPHSPIARRSAARWISEALHVTGNELRVSGKTGLRWADLQPGDVDFETTAALALVGVIPKPTSEKKFRPDANLTVSEFSTWLDGQGRFLDLWTGGDDNQADVAKRLAEQGVGIDLWCYEKHIPENLDRPILRAEICQAMFLLLKRAGF